MADPYTGVTPNSTGSALAGLLPTYFNKKVRELIVVKQGLWANLDVDPFPQRTGTTATLHKYADLADITSALTQGENPAGQDIITGSFTAAIVEYGGVVDISSLGELTTIDGCKKVAQIVGRQGRNSVELLAAKTITAYLPTIRADADSTYEVAFVSTSAGSTTTTVGTALTQADDAWNGGNLTCIDPLCAAFGETVLVTDFVASTDTLTHGAFSAAPGSGAKFHLSVETGIVAGDKITLTNMRLAQRFIRRNGGFETDYEISGGGYNIVYDTDMENDIGADSTLLNLFIYKEKEDAIRTYKPGKIAMLTPSLTSRIFRTADTGAGTYSATGVCRYAAIFGQNCAVKMPLEEGDIKVIAKGKDTGGVANPLNRYSTTGWEIKTALMRANTAVGCAIVCGSA